MYEQIRYEVEEPIAVITLHRPARLNAWTDAMGREIEHALAAATADQRVVAIVMTGAGRGFCAGADMQTLGAIAQGASSTAESPQRTFAYPLSIPKPIIGAVNGPCVGLGLVIALYCDVRIASDQATFSTAFARRGLIAEWGCSWLLPRLVGLTHAMDLLLSARTLAAEEALRIGLVSRVVPHGELMQVTRAYALEMARNCSPRSLAVIKRQVLHDLLATLSDSEKEAMKQMLASFAHRDFAEGVSAFVEKRPPVFDRIGD